MTPFFHTALSVISKGKLKGKHITTMFSEFTGSGKFSTSTSIGNAHIIDVVYWENVDVTVALVDCAFAWDRYEFFTSLGFNYDLEYQPHITVSKESGNCVEEFKHLIGTSVTIGKEYFKPMYKE
jgi:hypothetical protein